MSALSFVIALLETGRVRVPADGDPQADVAAAVEELDRALHPDLPADPPPLDADVAAWALTILYRGCQALVHREIEGDAVRAALAAPCPADSSSGACYSTDLAFRYLPDLLSLARGIAPADPLVAGLMELARAWPLSSVGVKDLREVDVTPFIDDPCLRQLYVDRIIERGDVSRLGHPAVDEAVQAALGAHPELAPAVAAAIRGDANSISSDV